MKKNLILAAVFTLFAAVISVSAQDKPAEAPKPTDFSGKWVLDISKSKLEERMRIESMTLTVSQTAKDIKTESLTKRTPPRDNMTPGGGPRWYGRQDRGHRPRNPYLHSRRKGNDRGDLRGYVRNGHGGRQTKGRAAKRRHAEPFAWSASSIRPWERPRPRQKKSGRFPPTGKRSR